MRLDVCLAMQVLCMPLGQQQMVMMRLYSYVVSMKPQVRGWLQSSLCSHKSTQCLQA
jgi:hypothetical protein